MVFQAAPAWTIRATESQHWRLLSLDNGASMVSDKAT